MIVAGALLAVGLAFADLHTGAAMGRDVDVGLVVAGLAALGVHGGVSAYRTPR